ncbi:hypothetical protein T492DRAFT_1060247 [Pavlovales sp. CCMP2436]|nr:hypothetical protein T492DRAFT_1060247 [Pavlovales sp. CCMP2436]
MICWLLFVHLVYPCIHEAVYASHFRWMGDAVGPLISTKIFSWDKDGAAPTRVEYSDFAEQFELKPGDKFEKMLDDVYMLHRLSELNTRTTDIARSRKRSTQSAASWPSSSRMPTSSLRRSSLRSRRSVLLFGLRPRAPAWPPSTARRRSHPKSSLRRPSLARWKS